MLRATGHARMVTACANCHDGGRWVVREPELHNILCTIARVDGRCASRISSKFSPAPENA